MKIEIALASVLTLLSLQSPVFCQEEGKQEPKKEAAQDAVKADPEVDAWVQVLAQKIGDKNETIARSAESAIANIGKPALATLRKVAEDKDAGRAAAAKRLITRIEAGPQGGGMPGGRGGQPGGGGGRPDPIAQVIAGMDLTKDQKAKVDEVHAAVLEKTRELGQKMRSGELDMEGMQKARQEITQDATKKLKGVLSDEQIKKIEEAMAQQPGRRRGGN